MMLHIMGEMWWRQKKLVLTLDREDQKSAHQRMMKRELRHRERMRQKQIRHDMGPVKYYLQKSKRSMFNEKYPPMTMEELELIKAQERDKLETELLQKQRDEEKRLEQELADSMSRGIPDMKPIPILSKLEQQAKADAEGASYGK
eukprot:FR738453.1.p1 GENE.FR738453.1~~FR738453.1.p1  ORF type:complete len:145 (+),score=27.37 FR738453.1:449-883(+)